MYVWLNKKADEDIVHTHEEEESTNMLLKMQPYELKVIGIAAL